MDRHEVSFVSLIQHGWFRAHSGLQLPFKVDCDALTDEDIEGIAKIVAGKFSFSAVVGVPTGGLRLAEACARYVDDSKQYPMLIVDDVLTTGRSMQKWRDTYFVRRPIGFVIFARGPCPDWIWALFTMGDWAQGGSGPS